MLGGIVKNKKNLKKMEKRLELIKNEEDLIKAQTEKRVIVAMTKKDYDLVRAFLAEKPKFIKFDGDGGYGKINAAKLTKTIAEMLKIEEAIDQMSITYKLKGDVSIRILTENGEEIKETVPFGNLETGIKMAIMTANCILGPEETKTIQVITRRGEKVYVTREDDKD